MRNIKGGSKKKKKTCVIWWEKEITAKKFNIHIYIFIFFNQEQRDVVVNGTEGTVGRYK